MSDAYKSEASGASQPTRPWYDRIRCRIGYRFPRLGPLFFKAFSVMTGNRVRLVELFPGIWVELDLGDLTQRTTYWQGRRYERPTAGVLCQWARDPRCTGFFDIGSNYGFYSFMILSQSPLEVHAFDPNPHNYMGVRNAKARNNLVSLHPHHLGLSDKNETLVLHHGVIDRGHSTFLVNPGLGNPASSECTVERFDDWLLKQPGLTPPDGTCCWIAKLDVEGFELNVLRGMERNLRAGRFIGLVVEMNAYTLSLAGTSCEEVKTFLAACGYVPYEDTPKGRQWPLHLAPNGFFVSAA